ncbi:MAG: hypothetical protein ACYS76_14735, partial [Planctomycetota bacterium]
KFLSEKRLKYNKKAACHFRQAACIVEFNQFLQQITACLPDLSCRPPPTTGIFAANLLHDYTIIPQTFFFVKPHSENIFKNTAR